MKYALYQYNAEKGTAVYKAAVQDSREPALSNCGWVFVSQEIYIAARATGLPQPETADADYVTYSDLAAAIREGVNSV